MSIYQFYMYVSLASYKNVLLLYNLKVNLRLISVANVVTFKFEDQCIILQLKLSLHGMIIKEYRKRIELILLLQTMEINA